MRDRRSTDERAKRSSIKIEQNWAENEPCGTPQVRGDEGELCGGIPTVDVRDERYEVNHCNETEEIPNQVERRWSRMEWLGVRKAADNIKKTKAGDLLHGDGIRKMVV